MASNRFRAAVVVCAATAGLLPMASGQASVNAVPILSLELNEPAGATTAADSSGQGHDGVIGSHIVMNGAYADWDRHVPDTPPAHGYDHLITVPDDPDGSLDPESGDFTIEFRFRTRDKFGNIMQKGQSRTYGGQVKIQAPKGKVTCMFRTPQGMATAGSGTTLLNDGQWHTIRCERTPTYVAMYVDNGPGGTFVRTGRTNNSTGYLNNKKPWTIGGKSECDQITVTCDYFPGDIDYVRMTKG